MKLSASNKKKSRVTIYHHYYKRKGVYTFLWKNSLKIIAGFGILIGAFLIFKEFVPNYNTKLESLLNSINTGWALSIFFISETILGLIPPDLFIIWSKKFDSPYTMVSLLAMLSYLGGTIAYFIGKYIGSLPKIENWILAKFSNHFQLIQSWGGVLIVFAALFPLPFSSICLVAGAVRFPFKTFLLLALFRFIRFFGYALVLLNLI
ncbi:MAG: membrane protein YqaA with SNARE-associated domain [Vicingaceae bacterium]|jgi:membrane protein YqaA with SNARE-associated domain